jgi:dihydroorotate dehydrogenase (NAD+) catalytic subunit
MAAHPREGRPWLGAGTGGLSGPAIRPVALAQVSAVAAAISVPVVGMGGVETGKHASDLLNAGATLVAVGTESFRDPMAGSRISHVLGELQNPCKNPAHRQPA